MSKPRPPTTWQQTDVAAAPPAEQEPELARRTGVGMAWGQLAKTLEVGLTFAIAVIAVRALQPDAFGRYSLLTNLAGTASVFIPIVTSESLGAVFPRFRERGERLFVLLVVAGLRAGIIVTVVAALAPAWEAVRGLFGLEAVPPSLFLLAGGYWLAQDLLNTVAGYYLAELHMRPFTVWKTAGQAVTLVGIATLAASGSVSVAQVLAVVAGGYALGAAGLAFGLLGSAQLRRPQRERIRFALGFTRNTWLFGVLSLAVSTQVYVVLIGTLTGDVRQAAFYAAAVGVVGRAQFLLISGWSSTIIPAFGEAHERGGLEGLALAWRLLAKLWLLVAVPINAVLLVLSYPLVDILFGASYGGAARLLLATAAFNIVLALLLGPPNLGALWALDRQGALAAVRVVTAPLTLAFGVALVWRYEALGAVVATAIGGIATALAELALARRAGVAAYPGSFAVAIVVAGVVAALPALALRPDGVGELCASLALAPVAFVAALALLRPFGPEDLRIVARIGSPLARLPLQRFARG